MEMAMAGETLGNLYLEYCRQAVDHIRMVDERMGPYAAEMASDQGTWVALLTAPAHERIAAGHLTARRFGICLPEIDVVEIRRGRKIEHTRIMIPGYIFVYVWGVAHHISRLRSCPGVVDFLYQDGQIRIIPWGVIDELRVIENIERPLSLPMQEVARSKKKKRRWRKSRRELERQEEPEPILSSHAYSPFLEEMRQAGLDDEARIGVFHRALGLGS